MGERWRQHVLECFWGFQTTCCVLVCVGTNTHCGFPSNFRESSCFGVYGHTTNWNDHNRQHQTSHILHHLTLLNHIEPTLTPDHPETLQEQAQLYVALSRFRSLDSVSISGLPSQLPRISPTMQRAVKFHESIGGAAEAPQWPVNWRRSYRYVRWSSAVYWSFSFIHVHWFRRIEAQGQRCHPIVIARVISRSRGWRTT